MAKFNKFCCQPGGPGSTDATVPRLERPFGIAALARITQLSDSCSQQTIRKTFQMSSFFTVRFFGVQGAECTAWTTALPELASPFLNELLVAACLVASRVSSFRALRPGSSHGGSAVQKLPCGTSLCRSGLFTKLKGHVADSLNARRSRIECTGSLFMTCVSMEQCTLVNHL